jgi:hypothetical protein
MIRLSFASSITNTRTNGSRSPFRTCERNITGTSWPGGSTNTNSAGNATNRARNA